jgi:hypothetical protein
MCPYVHVYLLQDDTKSIKFPKNVKQHVLGRSANGSDRLMEKFVSSGVKQSVCNFIKNWSYFFLPFFYSGLWGSWHCGHSWPFVPASGDSKDDCGEAEGM